MARFQDLSTELVLGILEQVLPEDIESMSLVSERIYQLAIPRLEEHRRLRKRYCNFRNLIEFKPRHWHDPGGLLADLLCNIMTDTRLGHYVKKLDFSLWNYGAKDGWKPDEVFEKQVTISKSRPEHHSKTHMDIIEEAIRAVEIIPTEEVDDWLHQIRLGNEDPLVALLFLYAPNLESLMFVDPDRGRHPSYLLKTIQRVAVQGSTVKPYPSHFKNVEICFAEGWEDLDFVKAFMSLPSPISITTQSLFIDGRTHETDCAILRQPSTVMGLSFDGCLVPEQVISELLRGVKNLKTFAYSYRHLWHEKYKPPFNFLAVMHSLAANANHTLETLELNASDLETSQIAPICRFSALRELKIRTSRCFVADSNIAYLVSVLPASIEKLAISWQEVTSADGTETLTEAFLDLIRVSKTRLPRLRLLQLDPGNGKESDPLFDCLFSDETAQINKRLAFGIQCPGGWRELEAWASYVCTCGQDCFGNDSL